MSLFPFKKNNRNLKDDGFLSMPNGYKKDSKSFNNSNEQWVLVEYRPWKKFKITLLIISLCAVLSVISFFLGQQQVFNLTATNSDLGYKLKVLQSEHRDLQKQHIATRDKLLAEKSLKTTLVDHAMSLEKIIKKLETDIYFYRHALLPDDGSPDIQVSRFELIPMTQDNKAVFHMTISQVGHDKEWVEGLLLGKVIGMNSDGVQQELLFEDFIDTNEPLKLKFRHFQNFSGTITLPDNFEPDFIELALNTYDDAGVPTVEYTSEQFQWLVKE